MSVIQHHWNKIVQRDPQKEAKARNYIRGSELGTSFVDRYLRMKGIPVTNPFEDRVLRIFDGGKATEFVVVRALAQAGLLNITQKEVRLPATDKTLEVIGHLDARIGGFVNWEEAKAKTMNYLEQLKIELTPKQEEEEEVEETEEGTSSAKLDFSLIETKAMQMIEGLSQDFPNGQMPSFIVEIKSVNSMAFWAHKNKDPQGRFLGYPHNILQIYDYMKSEKEQNGLLLYISRDDYTMEEIGLTLGTAEFEKQLQEDLEQMTYYYNANEMPPLEPEMLYNERKGFFELNWKVSRSQYLTYAYGYKTKEEFDEKNHDVILDINRAIKHLREVPQKEMELVKATEPAEKAKIQKSLDGVKKKLATEDVLAIRTYDLEQYAKLKEGAVLTEPK